MELVTRVLAQADLDVRGSDGRTVYGLAVPFDREATVRDNGGPSYREVFRKGAFRQTIKVGAERVKLLKNHNRAADPLGRALTLREDPAGLVGEFYISDTRDGNDTLQLIRDGALDAFSIGFTPDKHRQTKDGLVERLEVRLSEVSVVPWGAYDGALVAGVRAAYPDLTELHPRLTDEMIERLLNLVDREDLDTRADEAAAGTSDGEQSDHQDEQADGHSLRTRTRSQRQQLLHQVLKEHRHDQIGTSPTASR